MRVALIPSNEYRRVRWRNGQGWTREILRWPEGHEDWDWRASIAEVDQPGPFSSFPGCDREIVLLSGRGMRLCFDDGETTELLPPHGRHRFAGERPLRSELPEGPTSDFNLIWRRERVDVRLMHRPLVGSMLLFPEAGVCWLLHLLSGRAELVGQGHWRMEPSDTALVDAEPADRKRLLLNGGGEILLARIGTRPA